MAWRAASMVWMADCFRCVLSCGWQLWRPGLFICLPVSPVMAAIVYTGLRRSTVYLPPLLPYFLLAATRDFSALWQCQLPKPTEQAENVLHPGLPWRWVPWLTSTRVVAPGRPPTSSHFAVCSSQVLLDPLGTSFCSLLPPPLLLCKCLPMHGVCWDLGSPWLSGWSALCTAMSSAFLPENSSSPVLIYSGTLPFVTRSSSGFSVCSSYPSHFIPFLFALSISFPPFLFLLFSLHLHCILAFFLLFIIHVPCRIAVQKPHVSLWLLIFYELFPSSSFSHKVFYPFNSQDSDTRLRRCAAVLLILEENSDNWKFNLWSHILTLLLTS